MMSKRSVVVAFLAVSLFAQGEGYATYEASYNSTSSSPCVCTTVPCPVEGANYLQEGGGGTGTYWYKMHGDIPVVSSAQADITLSNIDGGTGTTSCTQEYSRNMDDDGVQDCDAGHILAHNLGGPGNQPINIFPQDLHSNRGAYAQFEGFIADCLTSGSVETASLSWEFNYEDTTRTKPYEVVYSAKFSGGDGSDPECVATEVTFPNESR